MQCVRISPFAGKIKTLKMGHIVVLEIFTPWVFFFYCPKCRWRGEQHFDLVFGYHTPERARVGRSDRLAFVEHRRITIEERRVDNIRMTNDPTHIGRRPVHISRFDAIDVSHGPLQGDDMTGIVPDHTLGLTGRS